MGLNETADLLDKNNKLEFFITSQSVADSVLFRTSLITAFVYKLKNARLSIDEVSTINNLSNFRKRILRIENRDIALTFERIDNKVFYNNLVLIDSCLPQLLSCMLLANYTNGTTKISDLCYILTEQNPLKFHDSHRFYTHKIKRFLIETALGMSPDKVWNGKYEETMTNILIKEGDKIVWHPMLNLGIFGDYLFNNTYLEIPSSIKHKFGVIELENNQYLFKLNLQIRFF